MNQDNIYGINLNKDVTAREVRDALVKCFVQAHAAEMEDFVKEMPSADAEKLKKLNVELLIRKYFDEVGGDFNQPTKENIINVMEKLKEFAANFRSKEVITQHYEEMMHLVNRIKE